MVKVTYVEAGGARHEIDVPSGYSVMEGAVRNGVHGIDADCGGVCACATCHVYVDESAASQLKVPSEEETDMLEFVEDVRPNSRLSCQLRLSEEHHGLIVWLPESQC